MSFVIASNYRKLAPKPSPHKGKATYEKGNSKNVKTVDYKVTSILCIGDVTGYVVTDLKKGTVAWIGEDQLELLDMEGYVGVYDKIDSNGNTIPRIPGRTYKQQVVLYHTPKHGDDDDDGDDEEGDIDHIIDGRAKEVAEEYGKRHATNYEKKSKAWDGKKNKATYYYSENKNDEYKILQDVIGKNATYDAVAKLYSGYFDENTFSGQIAEKVISMYFHADEDVEGAIKELECRHRHINNEG